jgi:predicted GH43/DUF377 family glycosyl hydrolase
MKWQKLGLIYAPRGELWWAKAYATLPTAEIIDDRVIRVYYASLDENRFGRIGFVDLDGDDPRRIMYERKEPVLDIGELGAFDDCGVNPSCILKLKDRKYLYYIGWQRCERTPYMLFSGLAFSQNDGQTFDRHSRVPVFDRTPDEPFSRSAPFVCYEGGVFKAWYWSCVSWTVSEGQVHYNTVINYGESRDGIHWRDRGYVCIAPESGKDYAVGRPWVIRDGDLYRMWYSIRSRSDRFPYRIGYAESKDGLNWNRRDDTVGIEASTSGWDSEMICYPCVVDLKGRRYLFYNGNRHGSTGFGCAILDS